jgi:hypothetical protein
MRLSLTTLLTSLGAVAVAARRGLDVPMSSPNSFPPFHPQRSHSLAPWGYPYGWGLDDNPLPAEDPEQVTEMKPVKRGKAIVHSLVPHFLWEATLESFIFLVLCHDDSHLHA